MEYLTDSNPALCLKIASYHQFFQDNPMVSSIGHSWTSKNRSDDCWFKVHASLVAKRNTVVFEPPHFFFGQSTPTLTDMCDRIGIVKTDIEDYLKSADAQVKDSKAILEDKRNKTDVSYEKGSIPQKRFMCVGSMQLFSDEGVFQTLFDFFISLEMQDV